MTRCAVAAVGFPDTAPDHRAVLWPPAARCLPHRPLLPRPPALRPHLHPRRRHRSVVPPPRTPQPASAPPCSGPAWLPPHLPWAGGRSLPLMRSLRLASGTSPPPWCYPLLRHLPCFPPRSVGTRSQCCLCWPRRRCQRRLGPLLVVGPRPVGVAALPLGHLAPPSHPARPAVPLRILSGRTPSRCSCRKVTMRRLCALQLSP